MAPERATQLPWDVLTAELRAYRDQQRQTWGDLDNALIGRYLAGEVTLEERKRVDAALDAHPDLRMLTDLVRDVLGEFPQETRPVVAPPVPSSPESSRPRLLPFPRPGSSPTFLKALSQRGVLVAAACLLLVLGITLVGVPLASTGSSVRLNLDGATASRRGGYDRDWQLPNQPVLTASKAQPAQGEPAPEVLPSFVVASLSNAVASGDAGEVAEVLLDNGAARKTLLRSMAPRAPRAQPPRPASLARDDRADKVAQKAALVLADGLAREGRPELHARYRRALMVVSPHLGETLQKTTDPDQQRRLLHALKQLGPQARPVVPHLERLAEKGSPEVRREARDALSCICVPQWVGIQDTAKVFPEEVCKQANERVEELARKHRVYFVAETVRSLPNPYQAYYFKAPQSQRERTLAEVARQRSEEVGADRGVFVLISDEPPAVHVTVGPDARARLAPRVTERAVREVIRTRMAAKDKDPDHGLAEAVRFIESNLASPR